MAVRVKRTLESKLLVTVAAAVLAAVVLLLVRIAWTSQALDRAAAVSGAVSVVLLAAATSSLLWSRARVREAHAAALQRLEASAERALRAERLKSEYLANLSHEVRTPLNGLLGMIELIERMPLEPKLRRYAQTMATSARALLVIVDEVLDLSKLEAGKYTLQVLPFEPGAVVTEVAELLASRAEEKGIELIHRTSPDLPKRALGDPERFRQVLSNLVANAIKFTDRGEVFIDASVLSHRPDGIVLQVAVHDSGVGIDAQDIPKLYQPFSQLHVSGDGSRRGSGLGLAICKRLVESMGGAIGVESELGRGSVFTFSVRLGAATETEPPELAALPGGRVLVIDPSRRSRDVTAEQLRAWHIEPECTESDATAIELAKAAHARGHPFHAVIISAGSANRSTAPLLESLRSDPALATLPLILLTRACAPGPAPSASLPGVFAELQKPIRFSDLYDCLAAALAPREADASVRDSRPKLPVRASEMPVLVVDDDEVSRFVLLETLDQLGYRGETAANGTEALEKLDARDYLCVLMDCEMPLMDGYQATRAIRNAEGERGKRRIPIVALTARALVEERERALAAGMDGFLAKPLRRSALEEQLRLHVDDVAVMKAPAADALDLDPVAARSERLIRLFVEKLPAELAALRAAIEGGRGADASALAHKIKGSCLALSARRMSHTAEAIRRDAESGQLAHAKSQLGDLMQQFTTVTSLLEAELSRRAGRTTDPGRGRP